MIFFLKLLFVLMFISGPHVNYLIKDVKAKFQKKSVEERKLLYETYSELNKKSDFYSFIKMHLKYYLCCWAPLLTVLRLLHIFTSHLLKSPHCTYSFMDPGYLARNAARQGDFESLQWHVNHGINPNFRDKRLVTLFEYLARNAAKYKNNADIYKNYVTVGAILLQKGASFNAAITPVRRGNEKYHEMGYWGFREYFCTQLDWFAIFPKLIGCICQYNIEKHFEENDLVTMDTVNPQQWNQNLKDLYKECQNLLQH